MEDYVWRECPTHAWVPVKLVEENGIAKYCCTPINGQILEYPVIEGCDVMPVHPSSLGEGVGDMIKLEDVSIPAMLHNLRIRYEKDAIYSSVGPILISINPYKSLPLYTPGMQSRYQNAKAEDALAPHLYQINVKSYASLLENQLSQSIVISGESGAGKSEATKVLVSYFAEASSQAGGSPECTVLANRLLEVSPILESFGNAKTVRNNNSSRFGKWLEIRFDSHGVICAGALQYFLLEKSRIVRQSPGERNYHIFYEMLAGMTVMEKEELSLTRCEDYDWVNQSPTTAQNHEDAELFLQLQNALTSIGVSPSDRANINRLIAALLHLGNITMDSQQPQSAEIADMTVVSRCAKALGCDASALKTTLCSRNLTAARRRTTCQIPRSASEANDAKEALGKSLYHMLFEWLVHRINLSLQGPEGTSFKSIGVLDIFGFECFETNSFEQLCINFANEKLQQHFNTVLFQVELKEYETEGVSVSGRFNYVDNQECLTAIEGKSGILSMLDEECVIPKGSDDGLLQKLTANFTKNKNSCFRRKRTAAFTFTFAHYAGDVEYNVNDWLVKNRDAVHTDFFLMLNNSSNDLVLQIHKLMTAGESTTNKGASRSKKSVASQFKLSLSNLMQQITSGEPHFVRCLKPNQQKVAARFDAHFMLSQLQYTGMMAACELRRAGFSVRLLFEQFYSKYKVVVPESLRSFADAREGCDRLLSHMGVGDHDFTFGKTKVFLRQRAFEVVRRAYNSLLGSSVVRVQSCFRGYYQRKAYKRTIFFAIKLQVCVRILCARRHTERLRVLKRISIAMEARSLDDIKAALSQARQLFGLDQHPDVENARAQVLVLEEENRLLGLLRDAIATRDVSALSLYVQLAEERGITGATITEARSLHRLLVEEAECVAVLTEAMEARSVSKLTDALEKVHSMQVSLPQVAVAEEMLQELKAIDDLAEAIASRDVDFLQRTIAAAEELTVTHGLLRQAQDLVLTLTKEAAAIQCVITATSLPLSLEAEEVLDDALQKAVELNLGERDAVKAGFPRLHYLQTANRFCVVLADAVASRDVDALEQALHTSQELELASLEVVKEARVLLVQLQEERTHLRGLREAVHARDLGQLERAISKCEAINVDAVHLAAAVELRDMLSNIREGQRLLEDAVETNSRSALVEALSVAENYGMDTDDTIVVAARRALNTLIVMEGLREAIASHESEKLREALASASNLGIECAEVTTAQELLVTLAHREKQEKVNDALQLAILCRKREAIASALEQANAVGYVHDMVGQAQALLEVITLEELALSRLEAVVEDRAAGEEEVSMALRDVLERHLDDVPVVHSAKRKLMRLKSEKELRSMCHQLQKQPSAELHEEVCLLAADLDMASDDVVVASLESFQTHQRSVNLARSISNALVTNDEAAILGALREAEASGSAEDVRVVTEALTLLRESSSALAVLDDAVLMRDEEQLREAIEAVEALPSVPNLELRRARHVLSRIREQAALEKAIAEAIASKNARDLDRSLIEAEKLGLFSEAISAGKEARIAFSQDLERNALELLNSAIASRTASRVQTALDVIDDMDWTSRVPLAVNNLRLKALQVVQRYEEEEGVLSRLQTAIEQRDLDALNVAVYEATTYDEFSTHHAAAFGEACRVRDELDNEFVVTSQLNHAVAYGGTKQVLESLLERARSLGLEKTSAYTRTSEYFNVLLYQEHARASLQAALSAKDFDDVARVLNQFSPYLSEAETEHATKLLRRHLEEKEEAERHTDLITQFSDVVGAVVTEKATEEQVEIFRYLLNDYHLHAYPGCSGDIPIVHCSTPITAPILQLRPSLEREALDIFKTILGFMGDRLFPFAELLHEEVIRVGREYPLLRDEIYCQIVMQLTENRRWESLWKGWQLLTHVVDEFCPQSEELVAYLVMSIARAAVVGTQECFDGEDNGEFSARQIEMEEYAQLMASYVMRRLLGIDVSAEKGYVRSLLAAT